jgi:hypothetical protein
MFTIGNIILDAVLIFGFIVFIIINNKRYCILANNVKRSEHNQMNLRKDLTNVQWLTVSLCAKRKMK